tara:strand:- start:14841 stop:16694 length:1854 start_codon:yes stop_codon:yes gene_type:complete
MLFPQQNKYRTVFDLGGYWDFKADPSDLGIQEKWQESTLTGDVHSIAIPGAWNEQLAEQGLKNYVGKGWHKTHFSIPNVLLAGHKIWLRVGAADHKAEVWVNGHYVGEHFGGYLPFAFDVTKWVNKDGSVNELTICVDSRLTMHTLPQGVDTESEQYNTKAYERRHLFPATRFDFFPYGGLTRSVNIVSTPEKHLSTIKIDTLIDGSAEIKVNASKGYKTSVRIIDAQGKTVVTSSSSEENNHQLKVENPTLWCPANPYLYTARVSLLDGETEIDSYDEQFGFREVVVEGGKILLNGEALFMSGFGKHEDFPIVGRGQFRPAYIRDYELMRWIGANSYRTSHYPYDEEWIRLADKLGFLVICETPAVSLGFWSNDFDELNPLLTNHKQALKELIERDYNHPSVISWSVTNEPNLWAEEFYQNEASSQYFKEIYDFTKALDSSRPIMAISMAAFKENDVVIEWCDVIGINRYYGWYTKPADIELAVKNLGEELDRTFEKYGKPIVITEFGADTVEGLHSTTAQMFTEEFQTEFTLRYLDVIEEREFCAGAHVWNFADFLTPQHFRRLILNKKGVFTRDRNPKSVAFRLRERWNAFEGIADNHRPKKPKPGFLIADIKK